MEWKEAWPLIDSVPGWMTEEESKFLFDAVSNCTPNGVIVEIGSYLGRSTTALVLGIRNSQQKINLPLVYTIDPFTAWVAKKPNNINISGPNWTYPQFIENMRKIDAMNIVRPLVMTSKDARVNWDMKIRFLFIDGNHDYDFVKDDYEGWFPHVSKGGIIALHDTITWEGPKKIVEEKFKGMQILKAGEISAVQKM